MVWEGAQWYYLLYGALWTGVLSTRLPEPIYLYL